MESGEESPGHAQWSLDAGGLAGLAEALQLFAAAALTGLLVVGLAAHFLPQATALAELPEAPDGVLDRFAGTDA
jgi:hypothetical protein